MKLHWSPRSPFVRKVMVCAHELDIAERIEKIYTRVSSSSVNEDMLRVNPIGRIPALVTDEGGKLYDSVVICEYLDANFGSSRLFPAVGPRRWDTLRRHALANGMLETLVLWRSESLRIASQQSPGVLAAFERKLAAALDAVERETVRSSDAPDIGDLTLAVALSYIDFRFAHIEWRNARARLAEWFDAMDKRASMQNTAHYDELNP